jgi:hypothetical protein
LPTCQTLAQLDFKNQFMLANPTYSRSDALEDKWRSIISNHIDYAFEPIVNIHTGVTFGFEALLRRYSEVGFSSIAEFFDTAYNESMLYHVELSLREKAVEKFARTGLQERTKLFLNVDNRIVEMPNYRQGNTTKLLARYGLTPSQICFEISEQHRFTTSELSRQILHFTRSQSYKIALDIISFAELLKKNFSEETCFIGHVGGDDFFLGTAAMDYEDLHAKLTATIDAFTESVKMFYDTPDVEALGITAKDRDGNVKKFPLLTVTAAALVLNEKKCEVAMEDITAILADLKKSAKGLSGIVSAASVI